MGVLIVFSTDLEFSTICLAVYGFVSLLGAFGAVATRKLFESSEFNVKRSWDCLERLGGAPKNVFKEIKDAASAKQAKRFLILPHVRLYLVWMVLHLLILLLGLAGVGMTLSQNHLWPFKGINV